LPFLALLPGSSRATVIDVGDVVVTAGHLEIGSTADGSRVVDGSTDGPYDSVSIASAAHREATPPNAASFQTPGIISVGNGGQGAVNIGSGSLLESAAAHLVTEGVFPAEALVSVHG